MPDAPDGVGDCRDYLGIIYKPLAMAVMIGVSGAFSTPNGYQTREYLRCVFVCFLLKIMTAVDR